MPISIVKTGESKPVIVGRVSEDDLKILTKGRYFFSWKKEKDRATLYKLSIAGEEDILGVMALVDIAPEHRMEITLLACSKENVGAHKIYKGIAGCLIGFACRTCVKKYGATACVSLTPKTSLKQHYMEQYGMLDAGRQLFVEGAGIISLIKKYLP